MKKSLVFFLVFVIVVAFCPFISTQALSSSTTQSLHVGIESGDLSLTPPMVKSNFGKLKLNGSVQVLTATLDDINITDATGTGEGWRLMINAKQFTDKKREVELPLHSLLFSRPLQITPNEGVDSPPPTIIQNNAFTIDSKNYHTILRALKNEGMGSYKLTFSDPTLYLAIDPSVIQTNKNHFDAELESIINWNIISGP